VPLHILHHWSLVVIRCHKLVMINVKGIEHRNCPCTLNIISCMLLVNGSLNVPCKNPLPPNIWSLEDLYVDVCSTAVNVSDISNMSRHFAKFYGCRNFRCNISRHGRHFQSVATLSLTRDIFPLTRESTENIALLIFYAKF
jgi:hypothetical protein